MKTENAILSEFVRKDGHVSTFKALLVANRVHKAQIMEEFKPSKLQKYALSVFDGEKENPILKALFDALNVQRDEIKFSILFDHGTDRELNHFDKGGNIKAKRDYFSILTFGRCLERYKAANVTLSIPKQIEKVEIKENKAKVQSKAKKAA